MGNVGISFGSPTSGQGFDVSATVDKIVGNMQLVETPWKNQLSLLQSQDTALTAIGADLSALSTALQSLTDFQGILSEKEGSSSDPSVLELTGANTSAVAGSHTVVVSKLAQTASWYSDALGSSDTLTGSLIVNGHTITISDGTAKDSNGNTIAANNNVASLASLINSANYGVTARVITDSGGSRLTLVSNTSGKAGDFTVDASALTDATNSNKVGFTEPQQGQDASFSVDGIPMSSASNTVSTAIPGVTFQLLSSAPSTSVQVEITNSNSAVESAVSTFVSAWNTVVKDMNAQEGTDASGNQDPLYGNPVLASIQAQLSLAMNFTQKSGSITSLSQLGIEFSSSADGMLTLNAGRLEDALNSNFADVVNFLQPSGTFTSFGANLTDVLDNLGNSGPQGALYLALKANTSTEKSLTDNLSKEETLIDTKKAQLTDELNRANYTLQQIPDQLQYVDQIYSAITGYNQKNS
jgi:flagellar hook-associated protein 2